MQEKSSVLKSPGIIMTIIMILEAILLFAWWPTSIGAFGIAKVGWLMIFMYFVWAAQCFIYIYWIEKREGKE